MRTKVLWGLAAAAAIVLAVLAYTGFPPVEDGTEGAIGAAKRYQAGQIAASDVKLGDQSAQQFMQSDLFDRIMKDESMRKALSDPALGKAWRITPARESDRYFDYCLEPYRPRRPWKTGARRACS